MSTGLPTTAEVVVVGAGCIGASIAVHLAQAGLTNVLLVDKSGPAAMTTGRSSAIVRQHYSQPTFARWAKESLDAWQRFDPPVFTRTGWAIVGGAADVEPMQRCVDLLRGLGVNTSLIDGRELERLDPTLDCADVATAAYEPDAGYCDPTLATVGMTQAFEGLGGRVSFGTRVVELAARANTWLVRTTHGSVETAIVVNAAGAYARELAHVVGTELPIQHHAHDVATFATSVAPTLALYDMLGNTYYRPDAAGALMAGSMTWSEGARVLDDPDAFPWLANPQVVARYERALAGRYRGAEPRLHSSHAGIYFITPDRYPIIGESAQAPGLFHACGFSHGFKVAPAVGKAIAARLIEGTHAAPALDEFRLTRFAEGQPITPLFPYLSGIQT